jgi:hypothetical protein
VQLDQIGLARVAEPGHRERLLRGELGRRTLREIARADRLHLGDVVRALDPRGELAELLALPSAASTRHVALSPMRGR